MPENGIPVADTTVQHVTRDEMNEPEIKKAITEFDAASLPVGLTTLISTIPSL
jgi:hypothetical protein